MKTCPNCMKEIADTDTECLFCGRSQLEQMKIDPLKKDKGSRRRGIFFKVFAVRLIFCAIVLIGLLIVSIAPQKQSSNLFMNIDQDNQKAVEKMQLDHNLYIPKSITGFVYMNGNKLDAFAMYIAPHKSIISIFREESVDGVVDDNESMDRTMLNNFGKTYLDEYGGEIYTGFIKYVNGVKYYITEGSGSFKGEHLEYAGAAIYNESQTNIFDNRSYGPFVTREDIHEDLLLFLQSIEKYDK